MNNNKRLKPNLLDPIIEKKIIKTLKPPQEDYWAPTKSSFQSFYKNYIRSNMMLVIFIIIIIMFLIYRYRVTKRERETKQLEKIYENMYHTERSVIPEKQQAIQLPKNDVNEYTNLLLALYNQQKENLREPNIKKFNDRMNPALNNGPKFAYPMYPYAEGGSFVLPEHR
jgi:hypothetical protein